MSDLISDSSLHLKSADSPESGQNEILPELTQINGLVARWERRLRLTQSAIWLPRAISGALLITLTLALISRVRPLLLPTPLIAVGIALIILMAAGSALIIWFWPRSALTSARFFDRQFGLRERLSTALEISGKIDRLYPMDRLRVLQIRDTLSHAREVNTAAFLPIRWQRRDLAAVLVLLLACGLAIDLPNVQTGVIAQQNALKAAVAQQIQQLQQIKQAIQANTALSDADKAQLAKIADQAIQQLEQPNVSQPEAVAALAQAQQAFANSQTPLNSAQQQADQQAGQALSQSGITQALGSALQKNDLSQAANALQALSQQTAQLTSQQSSDAAAALEAAAKALDSTNPQAAQAMRQAAAALRQQASANSSANAANQQAAQQAAQQSAQQAAQQASQALQSAENALNAAQKQASDTPLSQMAQNAAQQTNQGQQQIAQAGSPPNPNAAQNLPNSAQQQANANPQTGNPQTSNPQSGNPQTGNPQAGQQPNSQPGQQGSQPGQPNDQPGNQPGQQAGNQQGQGNQPGSQPGGVNTSNKPGGAQVNAPASGAGDTQTGASQLAANQQANGASGAGQGAGGSGDNTTKGSQTQGTDGQTMPTDNGHGDGSLTTTEHVYAPSFVGGQGGTALNPKGPGDPSNVPVQQGGYVDPSSSGPASVPLSNVASSASSQADSAMDAEHVPIGLRGVIHDYFSGLQPAK